MQISAVLVGRDLLKLPGICAKWVGLAQIRRHGCWHGPCRSLYMSARYRILAINPGSTTTKIACYDDDVSLFERSLAHTSAELEGFETINDQLEFRLSNVHFALSEAGVALESLSAVVGRGGLIHPVEGGTYAVNDHMIADLTVGVLGAHASNLGGIIADRIAEAAGGVPAYIVDPVVVDELTDEARLSGIRGLDRVSIFHALNQKAVARRYAHDSGRPYEDLALVVAHLGGGITVGAHKNGRVIDVNDGLNGDGPFTPERTGSIPALKVVDLCFSGRYEQSEIRKMIKGRGGLVAHLGTNDGREVSKRIEDGDTYARKVYRAMAFQISRSIGAAAAALGRAPDAIILTGGLAHDELLSDWIREQTQWIAPFHRYPGEDELSALAAGALRVLRGEETAREYRGAR